MNPPARRNVQIQRVVVHAHGDAAAGQRLAERLPAALERLLDGQRSSDEHAVRALIVRAVDEAAR